LKNGVTKITVLIISIIITIALIIGYVTLYLVSALKDKKELSGQIAELSGQKATLERNLVQYNSLLKAAKEKLRPLEEELSSLGDSLREKTLQEAKLQRQVSRDQADLQNFNDKITQYNNKIKELYSSLKVSRGDKASLGRANNKLNNELAAVTKNYDRAQESIRALKGKLSLIKNSNIPLRKKAEEYYKDISVKEKELAKLEQVNAALEKELNKIKSLNEWVVADFKAQIKELQDKIPQKEAKGTGLSGPKDTLAAQLQEANLKLDALGRANNFLEKQVEDLGISKKSLEDDLSKAREKTLGQDETRASLQETLKENLSSLKQALSEKERESLALKEELNKVGAQGKSLESELLNLKTALASREQELKQKAQDLENVNVIYNNLKIQLPQISNLLTQKELALDSSLVELSAYKEELATRTREKEAVVSQLQIMEKNITSLQAKYQDAQTELTLARKQYRRMVDEVNKAATFNASLQQSLSGLSQSVTQEEDNREKANDLKNKVEVILMPQENKE
jgi:chromosome segregation ATPase